ncbi:MAG: putative membrane protein YfcA [Arenicella sp.]
MIELFSYSLSYTDFACLVAAAALIGMAKTGVSGAGMIAVPVLAIIFGGKGSTGLLLPILIFADFFGVYHYRQHANWHHLRRLLPFAVLGVIIGTISGNYIDDAMFRNIMAVIIFLSLTIMIWQQQSKAPMVPSSFWFVATIGILGGFTTMVGNLAGPVMALYLLAMQFNKNQFIGTAAWFFLSINIIKIPFHVFAWKTITLNSFLLGLTVIPAVACGAFLGIYLIKRVPENLFRWFIIVMTGMAAVAMIV